MNWTFLSCKTLFWFILIYDCGLTLIYDCGLYLPCLNFDRTMNWFSIPVNIYFAIVATIVCISSGEPNFSAWFLTCPFSSTFLAKTLFDLWLIYDCGLFSCNVCSIDDLIQYSREHLFHNRCDHCLHFERWTKHKVELNKYCPVILERSFERWFEPLTLLTWCNIPVNLMTWTVIPEQTNDLFDRSLN